MNFLCYNNSNRTQFYYLYPILRSESGQVVIEAALSSLSMWVWVVKLSFILNTLIGKNHLFK